MTTVISFTPHSHESQDQAIAITKLRASLKEHAAGSRGTVTQLIVDYTTDTPVNIRADLGKPETIKRSFFKVGFCPSGVLSELGFVRVGFCPSGVLSEWGYVQWGFVRLPRYGVDLAGFVVRGESPGCRLFGTASVFEWLRNLLPTTHRGAVRKDGVEIP